MLLPRYCNIELYIFICNYLLIVIFNINYFRFQFYIKPNSQRCPETKTSNTEIKTRKRPCGMPWKISFIVGPFKSDRGFRGIWPRLKRIPEVVRNTSSNGGNLSTTRLHCKTESGSYCTLQVIFLIILFISTWHHNIRSWLIVQCLGSFDRVLSWLS